MISKIMKFVLLMLPLESIIFLKNYIFEIFWVKNGYKEDLNLSNESATMDFFLSRLSKYVSLNESKVLMASMTSNNAYGLSSLFSKAVYISLDETIGGGVRRGGLVAL